jgi:predicted nuclease of restriction endonuclease-like RecB superfamily
VKRIRASEEGITLLTVDLVQSGRRGDRLFVRKLEGNGRRRAETLAEQYLAVAAGSLGMTRQAFDERAAEIGIQAKDRKLADGLLKLVRDRCQFEMAATQDPIEIRREVFQLASRFRSAAQESEPFNREVVLDEVAFGRELDHGEIEGLLYADLKRAHRLVSFDDMDAGALVEWYLKSQHQAVLLKATRISVVVGSEYPGGYRTLFHKLKFLRLLHVITPLDDGRYKIEIDGPYALFRSVTKYGFQLAMLLPALESLDSWRLDAEVIWGKEKRRLNFRLEDKNRIEDRGIRKTPFRLPDEIATFVSRFKKLGTLWDVESSAEILELSGVGLCVPDLVFTQRETGEQVFFEVLGFWSREAVWRRVELVEKGLPYRIVFAVSRRLRVSQEVLGEDLPGSLYVYKGVMDPRRVAELL